jgi:YesN/AraC family two-component response regulator
MPGADGLEVLKAIKAVRGDLPVIIMSGHAEFEYAREALRLGARAYLLKPIDRAELARTLESLFAPSQGGTGEGDSAESNRVVREVRRSIAENLQTDLSLQGLADQVRLNSQYLSKLFKEETGENLTHCISRLRVDKARRLLETTHLKVYEIADLCGFGNVKRFLAVFKEISGETPSSYRKP